MPDLDTVHRIIASHLDELSDLFADHCKLTFIMRNPEVEDGNLICTDDDLVALEACIRHQREKDA